MSWRGVLRIGLVGLSCLVFLPRFTAAQGSPSHLEPADCGSLITGSWIRNVAIECHWLVVPEVRERPGGRSVRIPVAVVRAPEPDGSPPLVYLHGGPGDRAGGLWILAPLSRLGPARHRDLVAFDQRGAGRAQPALCPDYEPVADKASTLPSEVEREALRNEGRTRCAAELKTLGVTASAYSTDASVRDLIELRHLLGYPKWDLLGVSYGALLAQEAMRRDAAGIRAVLLESPQIPGSRQFAEAPLYLQRFMERVFAACAAQPACHSAFPTLEDDFYRVYDSLTLAPLEVPGDSSLPQRLDGQRMLNGLRRQNPFAIARVPLVINALARGDRMRAARALLGTVSAEVAGGGRTTRALVNCADHYTKDFEAELARADAAVRAPFRRMTAQPDAPAMDCELYFEGFVRPAEAPPVVSDLPTLVVSGYFDDRTPPENARQIAATLSHAYVYVFPNEAHGAPPFLCHGVIFASFLEHPDRRPDDACLASVRPITFQLGWPVP